jgi:tetratricopeptide (TPR) repeat protein
MSHEILDLARWEMRQGNWDLAVEKWQKAIELLPDEITAYQGMGNALMHLEKFDRAESIFLEITHKWPHKLIGFNSLSNLAMHLKQWELAKERWQQAIDKFPHNIQAYEGLGKALIKLEQFQAADVVFQQIIQKWSRQPLGYIALAELAAQLHQWQLSAVRWRVVINNFPQEIKAYIQLASNLIKLKKFDRAESIYKKINRQWPEHPAGLRGLANLAANTQQWQLAQARWQTSIETFPDLLFGYEGLGNALIQLEKMHKAEQIFQGISQKFPDNPSGLNGLIDVAIATRQWHLVRTKSQELIDRFPDYLGGYSKLGLAYLKLGEFALAESVYKHLMVVCPNSVFGFNGLANIAMQTQQWELAKTQWQIAIDCCDQMKPNLTAYIGKVEAAIKLKQWEEAEITLRKIISQPDYLEAIFNTIVQLAFYTSKWELVFDRIDLLLARNSYLIERLELQNKLYLKLDYLFKYLLESHQIIAAELLINKLTNKSKNPSKSSTSIAMWQSRIASAKAEYKLADEICLEAIDRQPKDIDRLNLHRLQNYAQQNNFDRVLEIGAEFKFNNQQNYGELKITCQALRIVAQALLKLGKVKEAKQYLQQIVRSVFAHPSSYILLIEVLYFGNRDYKAALAFSHLAFNKGIWDKQIIFYQALCLSALGNTNKALETIDCYLAKIPTDKLAQMYRVQILRDNYKYRDSIEQLNQILIAGGYTPIESTGNKSELTIDYLQCKKELSIDRSEMVSVIMTVYQHNAWLPIAISSILQQTYRNLELIIVDDASTDDTWEYLQQLAQFDRRIRLIKLTTNVGTYVAKNEGMLYSRGDYIAFMDADDWVHPQKLAAQVDILQNSDAVATTCGFFRVYRDSNLEFKPDKPLSLACISLCFKKNSVLPKIGFFDAARTMADSEYENRLKIVFGTHSIQQIPEPLLISMRHENSISGGGWKSTKLAWHGNQISQYPYIVAYQTWHGSLKQHLESPYLPHPLDYRRFACPKQFIP